MPELSRSQVLVYGAVAIALLLVGARAIRAEGDGAAAPVAASSPSDSGDFSLKSGAGLDIVVDVAGAVQRPGVYRLPSGARVVDAIERAGGAAGGALLEGINRAARLADGQQVMVPKRGPNGSIATAGVTTEDGPISLGSARRRAARHDRRHRPGDRRQDRRIPRPARRPGFGRPARSGERHRAGDDGIAAGPAAAIVLCG